MDATHPQTSARFLLDTFSQMNCGASPSIPVLIYGDWLRGSAGLRDPDVRRGGTMVVERAVLGGQIPFALGSGSWFIPQHLNLDGVPE